VTISVPPVYPGPVLHPFWASSGMSGVSHQGAWIAPRRTSNVADHGSIPRREHGQPRGLVVLLCAVSLLLAVIHPDRSANARSTSTIDLALMDPSELAQRRDGWVVLDGRPKSEWQAGHIPGAYSFSWEQYTHTDDKGVRFRIRGPQELAQALGGMGIDENSAVLIYGDADKSWGGEGWACWVLAWLGHKGAIRLMTGGVQSWRQRGFPVSHEASPEAAAPASYRVSLRQELDVDASELERNRAGMVVIDTRSTLEWLKGHLPSAVHIPWTEFYRGKDRRPLDSAGLRKLLEDHGVDWGKPVFYYCAGGVRSGYAWTVHTIHGLSMARNYKGGMEDWKRRSPM
jgi:thiosulfate/3-mercaptopyruvate sulfurtransferase